MIELKDVIHYYRGCEVLAAPFGGQPERGERGVLIGVHENVVDVKLYNWQSLTAIYHKHVKPILRRLEDMTDMEWDAVEGSTSIIDIAQGMGCFKLAFLEGGPKDRYHWSHINEGLIELRKRGIDCDNLINTGQAIDAKTLANG